MRTLACDRSPHRPPHTNPHASHACIAQVYNNVFVSEQNGQGARGKGVSVDRDTPLRHLTEAKAALDEIVAFKQP